MYSPFLLADSKSKQRIINIWQYRICYYRHNAERISLNIVQKIRQPYLWGKVFGSVKEPFISS